MGTFSRWMPERESLSPLGEAIAWTVLAALGAGAVWLVLRYPWSLLVVGLIALHSVLINRRREAQLRRLAASRAGESLCTFTRALPRAERDPWAIRAVYGALSRHVRFGKATLPLRPSDRLVEDLRVDPDDLNDLVYGVADRIGRDMDRSYLNPYYDRVVTIADLLAFLRMQPRAQRASAAFRGAAA